MPQPFTSPLLSLFTLVLVSVLAPDSAFAADQQAPGGLTREQQERLKDRERWEKEFGQLREQGKLKEAIAVVEKILALERMILGNTHPDAIVSLQWLAELHEQREDFPAARKFRREALEALTKLRGEKHWEVTNARLALAHLDRLAKMEPAHRKKLTEATRLLSEASSLNDQNKRKEALPLVERVAAARREILGEEHPETLAALNFLGELHLQLGKHVLAEDVLKQTLEARRTTLGAGHPQCAVTLNALGVLYYRKGRYAQAVETHRKAVEIRTAALGETHPDTLHSLRELAVSLEQVALKDEGRENFAASVKVRTEVLALRRKTHGERNWQVTDARLALTHAELLARLDKGRRQQLDEATRLIEKVGQLSNEEKYHEAVPLAEKALAIRQEILGEQNRHTATAWHWLGYLFNSLGDFKAAKPHVEKALAVRRTVLGEEHAQTVSSMNNMGFVLLRTGDIEAAEPLFRRICTLQLKLAGEESDDYATYRNNLADVLSQRATAREATDDCTSALKDRREVLDLKEKVKGKEHHETTDARLALAHSERLARLDKEQRQRLHEAAAMDARVRALIEQDKPRSAVTLAERALAARKELLGEDDLRTLESFDRLRYLHQDLGEPLMAEPLQRKVVELRKKLQGETHPDYPRALDGLALLNLTLAGKQSQAEKLYREALEVRKRTLGDKHADTVEAQKRLADFYEKWVDKVLAGSDVPAAVQAVERRLAFQREALGGPPELVMRSLLLLARVHEFGEDFAAAEKVHRERLALMIKLRGEDHPQVGDARFALANVRLLGKLTPDQRKELRETELLRLQASDLARDGKLREALDQAIKALERRKAILGEKTHQYADCLATVGRLHLQLKDYDKAEPLLRQALTIRGEVVGKKHPIYAGTLESLAGLYAAKQDYARAEPLYHEAVAICKVAYRETESGYTSVLGEFAAMLDRWADQLASKEDFTAARKRYQEVVDIQTRLHGEKHWKATDARLALAYAEQLAGMPAERRHRLLEADHLDERIKELFNARKDKEAIPLLRKSAETRKELLGAEHPRYATSLYILAALLGKKEVAESLPLTRQATVLVRRTLGEKHPAHITCLYNLGNLSLHDGDHAAAEAALQKCLALHREILSEKDHSYVILLDSLADLYIATGDYSRAESFCHQAQALREQAMTSGYSALVRDLGIEQFAARYEAGGGKHPDYLRGLERLAHVYMEQGRYSRAEPLFRQVRNIRFKDPGEKHPSYAMALNSLGWLYAVMGDHAEAEPLLRQAREILKDSPDDYRQPYASVCNNLARLYYKTSEYDRAEPLFKEALDILARLSGKRRLDYAIALDNTALLHADREEYAKAEDLYRQALKIKKEVLGEKHPVYATSLNNLAEMYQARGDFKGAEPLFQQALEVSRAALGEKHPEYVITLHNLALLAWQRGDRDRALRLMRQSVDASTANLELAATVQSERQQLIMGQTLRGRLDALLTLAPQVKLPAEQTYRHVLAWKGSVLLRQRRLRLMRQSPEFTTTRVVGVGKGKDGKEILLIGTEASKFEELEAVTSRLATLAFAVADPARKEEHRRQIEMLTEYKEELEAELARVGEKFGQELELTRLTAAGVREILPADAALVDFLEYTHSTPLAKGEWKREQRLAAFIVRHDSEVEQIDLGSAESIAAAVARWRKAISQGKGKEQGEAASEVRKLVWDRLSAQLKGARTILVSPDGATSRLPFAALPGKAQGSYLIEEQAVAVLPVPRLLPELMKKANPVGEPSLLLVGAVDFNAAPGAPIAVSTSRSALRGKLGEWPALEGTGTEITAVKESFRRRYAAGRVSDLRQKEPTESAVRQQAPKHRYLHFATHGFFAPPELRSALSVKSKAERPTGTELFVREGVAGFHPGVLAGLVLAGANQPGGPTGDDGILTALEMAGIDLSGVELATLSACETGLGEEAGGEGLLGLQRAFQAAGARSVVSGLWKVDDNATQALMREFYRQLWEEKRGKLDALRQAQLAMLRRYDPVKGQLRGVGGTAPDVQPGRLSPFYWAAFSLSGDWR
jgi:CHAT domain-containing protein